MKQRIIALIVLAPLAGAALVVSAIFSRRLVNVNETEPARESAQYFAEMWMIAFVILAAAWIWLLVKTVGSRFEEQS